MDKIGLSRQQLKQKEKREDLEGVRDLSVVPSKNLQDSGKESQL